MGISESFSCFPFLHSCPHRLGCFPLWKISLLQIQKCSIVTLHYSSLLSPLEGCNKSRCIYHYLWNLVVYAYTLLHDLVHLRESACAYRNGLGTRLVGHAQIVAHRSIRGPCGIIISRGPTRAVSAYEISRFRRFASDFQCCH